MKPPHAPQNPAEPPDLCTPVHLNTEPGDHWPDEPVFFSLAGNGLFLCRNHRFFRSRAFAPNWPSELAPQEPFLQLTLPKIDRRYFELAVGFFYRVYRQHGSEAGVLLVWDEAKQRIRLVCPPQVATVSRLRSGYLLPVGLHYQIPDLKGGLLVGDIHSHADESAYASATDKADEHNRGAGLHVVVGRLRNLDSGRRPDVYADLVVDGTRFNLKPSLVVEGYRRPRVGVPKAWTDAVQVAEPGALDVSDHASAERAN
jgi:Prokaryotic homologs of the JAB domain